MRRRRLLAVALVASGSLIVAGLLALPFLSGPSRIDRPHFDQLTVGAPSAEVEHILGGPPRNECDGDAIVWVRRDGRRVSAELPARDVTLRFFADAAADGQERVWVGESGLIAILVTPDGLVRDKYFSDVHVVERPTVMSAFTRLFGR
jgi:hypothetical protein